MVGRRRGSSSSPGRAREALHRSIRTVSGRLPRHQFPGGPVDSQPWWMASLRLRSLTSSSTLLIHVGGSAVLPKYRDERPAWLGSVDRLSAPPLPAAACRVRNIHLSEELTIPHLQLVSLPPPLDAEALMPYRGRLTAVFGHSSTSR